MNRKFDYCLKQQSESREEIPPPCMNCMSKREGLANLKRRIQSLGLKVDTFIDSYISVSKSTFYNKVKDGTLSWQDILSIGVVLRLNPKDYIYYRHDINKNTVNSRLRRAKIKLFGQDEASEVEETDRERYEGLKDLNIFESK